MVLIGLMVTETQSFPLGCQVLSNNTCSVSLCCCACREDLLAAESQPINPSPHSSRLSSSVPRAAWGPSQLGPVCWAPG